MKGQFVFEFLIAGVIFFAIVLYAMNYLNVNVSDFKGRFYVDKLQSKALQISEILGNEKSSVGLVEGPYLFNASKIADFNTTYCIDRAGYMKMREDFELTEKTEYGERMHNANITLVTESGIPILQCGYTIPMWTEKAEIERFGILNENNELVTLRVIVW
ncbi:MAG: hypothetical protein GTN38_00345 [Candidatus Aenigmarchaeota archaeon]|nr:hypothetical protein [Candidatus Aenigmarchaeota archaeon]NIP39953.1 hypothetical protein [Candidatus Aenigmarchaeota archaeon]NIQ17672.1 hypothetical protein [Candidatus Aenigmarchaeota archaeon]NIS72860.1 hypothetical protein [Candidatus Aenigmarchaeota archaeon]